MQLSNFSFSSFRLLLILVLLSLSPLLIAEINSSIDKLQGRNKSSVTDEIKKKIEADQEATETVDNKASNKTDSDTVDTAKERPEPVLGINTADVREDTSSVQFLDLFKSSIPFKETVPWGSSKGLEYDKNGWPTDLKEGQAGTKFLNRLPEETVEDGFFTVLYDGEGTIFYGNDARLIVHRPNKDIIEIKAGKDKILNASLFIKKSNPDDYIRNIRILPEGGICKGVPHIRVKSDLDCDKGKYLSFEDNHLNPLATEQRSDQLKEETDEKSMVEKSSNTKGSNDTSKESVKAKPDDEKEKSVVINKQDNDDDKNNKETKTIENTVTDTTKHKTNKPEIKGYSDVDKAIVFNPDYLDFMKDFQVVRFMNMSGMTRNPVEKWEDRNTLRKASWGGKYGSRGAPVEVMVALSNRNKADPWFSMPYKASDEYIREFGEYVNTHLDKDLKAYIEYSNEVWNPIFTHHDYAIAEGMKLKLDEKKSIAGYKWYSLRSVETFKIWEKIFGGTDRLVRVLGSWASNQTMSSTILSYKDAFKHTDAIAIGPYFSAHPRVLRRAKTVDDVFKAMLDKTTKWGMDSTLNYIKKQANVAKSYGVDLVAYEGGQHLVDWNTRKVDEHPNKLLYAANRDPRMGILYDELMEGWQRNGGKLFVAFSAPRIYSWYGSWGLKEHIRQPRSEAPKYDSLLRYLNARLYPEEQPDTIDSSSMKSLNGEIPEIPVIYAKAPNDIWSLKNPHIIKSTLKDNSKRDISASWQASWDTKHLYISLAVNDDDLETGDSVRLTLDTTTDEQIKAKKIAQEKIDIQTEKKLLAKKKEEQAARKKVYEARAKAQAKKEQEKKGREQEKEKNKLEDTKTDTNNTDSYPVKEEKSNTSITKEKKDEESANKTKETSTKSVDEPEKTVVKKEKEKLEVINDKVEATSEKTISATEIATQKIEKEIKESLETNNVASKFTSKEKELDSKDKTVSKENSESSKTEKVIFKEEIESKIVEPKTKDSKTNSSNIDKAEKTDLKDQESTESNNDQETVKSTNEEANNESPKVISKENAISFIFTPFDDATSQARTIKTDAGYLLNLAIPWNQIYSNNDSYEIEDKEVDGIKDKDQNKDKSEKITEVFQAKPGDKLGINFVISDVDIDEKGSKELRSADTNLPLPKIVLKNSLVE
ncbi:hypothetical protein [uncultured Cocleimonas sp.]|uniref:hypothetical protein n=1 Tax=uncultured Cocleimonas sp. TaxID=1051587 RepID=UPI0026271C58|nr:hypothetical protein [uncultured Cocleimonas sp.]